MLSDSFPQWWACGLSRAERQDRDRAAGPAGPPAWARVVERAVAAAPTDPADGVPAGTDPLAAFAVPLRPLVDQCWDRVEQALPGGLADLGVPGTLRAEFRDQLDRQLAGICARVMVAELNRARGAGRLAAPTPEARFAEFIRQLAGRRRLAALFADYPVLARLVGQAAANAAAAYAELLARLRADRVALTATLLGGVDPGPLVSVTTGAGDRHQGGRSVALLRFAGGARLAYKPRPLAVHEHFGELVGWLNGKVPGLGLRTAAALPRCRYGWIEYVAARPCSDAAEMDTFYWRLGVLVALLYAVEGTDIHYENLIAVGGQPVLVDLETLFHPPALRPTPATGSDPAGAALASSVLRTALLPQLLLGEHGVLDVSGIGGDAGSPLPTGQVGWADPGTDRMRLERCPAVLPPTSNRPRLANRNADPAEHADALLSGFRLGYDAVTEHRAELLGPSGLLARFGTDETRILARQTELYARLLDESTHPDALRDGVDRDRLLDLLEQESAGDARLTALARYERAELWDGDTPMFTGRPGSPDLWTGTGDRLPGLLDTDVLAAAGAKIAAMRAVDRNDQEWCVKAALATRGEPPGHPVPATGDRTGAAGDRPGTTTDDADAVAPGAGPGLTGPDPQHLLAAACALADELVGRAIHGSDRANWVGLEPVEDRYWAVLPMGGGLGHGYTGVALFLAQLGLLTGIGRYRDLARQAIRPLPRLLDALVADPELAAAVGTGALLGLGGVCYALARLAVLLADGELRRWLDTGLELVGRTEDAEPGVAAGSAGGLAALLAVHAETGLPLARQLAGGHADRLLSQLADGEPDPGPGPGRARGGFCCGQAGSGWALLRYAAVAGPAAGARHAAAGRAALLRAAHLVDTAAQTGAGTGAGTGRPGQRGCCGGEAGVLLALGESGGSAGQVELLRAYRRCATRVATGPALADMSLCHGETGVIEALAAPAGAGGAARAARPRRVAALLDRLDRTGPRCGTPAAVVTPGLLTGLAGIGYGLLRVGFPDQVPSVLTLGTRRPG